MSTVLLLRHAQSAWNAEGRWQGQADPPLSPHGERQAETAGRRLRVWCLFAANDGNAPHDLVVSSGLLRARRTAEILASSAGIRGPQVDEPLLKELHVGQWSGRTRAEIDRLWPDQLAAFDGGAIASPPGGETREAFDERIGDGVEALVRLIEEREAPRTLVVAHGGVLRSIARLAGWDEIPISNMAGFLGSITEGKLTLLERVNLLDPAGMPPADGTPGTSAESLS